MLKLAVAVILCACAFAGLLDDPDWISFKQRHGKHYESLEKEQNRYDMFMKIKQEVDRHNQEFKQGKHHHSKGMNQFSDLSPEEMNSHKGLAPITPDEHQEKSSVAPVGTDPTVPDSINWVEKGAVTPVQNQGQCNSCWTFASAAALEGKNFIATGTLTKLSEQNILDCSTSTPTCVTGGRPSNAFNYVAKNNGVDTEKSYPYNNPPKPNNECKYTVEGKGGSGTGYKHVHISEEALKQAVAQGPVVVCIASGTWQSYKTGVYSCPSSVNSPSQIDHAVTAVGYGTDPQHGDYWLIKNSWATTWGEKGYIRLARNGGNNCFITEQATYPTVSNGPAGETATAAPGALAGAAAPETTDTEVPPPSDGEDAHEFCCWWAKIGFCDIKPFFMRPNCQKACGTPGCKVDNAHDCAVTVNLEGCPWKDVPVPADLQNIKKPTTYPVGSVKPGCDNTHKLCSFWAWIGQCDKNIWMGANCKAACSTCDVQVGDM